MSGLEVIFLIGFWAWAVSALVFLRNTFLPRLPLTSSPSLLNLPSETVHFLATDGAQLEGWILPSHPIRPWVILCHGLGSNRTDLLELAGGLHRANFNLLLFDFRGHGGSSGRTSSFGWLEQRDLEGVLAFLGQRSPAHPYGVYGVSMGGAVALMVAESDERIGAMAVDSVYTNLEEALARHLKLLYPMIPREPFLSFILLTYRLRFSIWPRQVSPKNSTAHLSPRPLLLIHGAQDHRMPLEGARQTYARAGEPKELWVVDQAGHLEAFALDPAQYLERLVTFFESSLQRKPVLMYE